ncbi:DUF2971 domain-containing protein [Streptomyces pactum]|uniref:DUF2971 domain-containing protein n=1 Tax=Streptomyces pactum TaxID=68249 RepID=A0ABS0NM78_9ACTN|nr:DUF2971 domain-containing protein [Streptomyces pactum]MBH5336293.1 DUF2971 domain-containing protein [Streptomyces pactum]
MDFSEYETLVAPRELTGHLFHYTSVDAAVSGILPSQTLRLSPYTATNDLWESEPHYPVLTSSGESPAASDFTVWDDLDRQLRQHAKVACLTQDIALPESVFNPDALRGWAHLALWAHYGGRHAGVCLRFDRERLVASFLKAHAGPTSLAFHGPVHYLTSQNSPVTRGVDTRQVGEFGSDAVALAYGEKYKDQLFFRKHLDWDSESEYRLVVLNQTADYEFVDIREALTGVILGSAFPPNRVTDLLKALEPYEIPVEQIRYLNRRMQCLPFEKATLRETAPALSPLPSVTPRRTGSLAERWAALRAAEAEAKAHKESAAPVVAAADRMLFEGIGTLAAGLADWPATAVDTHSHTGAIPPEHQQRSPGLPGETVYAQTGYMCVVENLPTYSYTLVAAAAVQVLAEGRLRLHAVITTESWRPNGNRREEHWRDTQECATEEIEVVVTQLLTELTHQVHSVRPLFDQERSQQTPSP